MVNSVLAEVQKALRKCQVNDGRKARNWDQELGCKIGRRVLIQEAILHLYCHIDVKLTVILFLSTRKLYSWESLIFNYLLVRCPWE